MRTFNHRGTEAQRRQNDLFSLCVSLSLWFILLVAPPCGGQTEPPLVGQPKDFSGLIGQYSLAVRAAPTEVKVEEPITLTVSIRGLSAKAQRPDLKQLRLFPETFSNDFHIEEPERVVEKDGTWELEYRVHPKHAGAQTLPSLKLVYYHPQRQKYQTTYSEAVALKVLPRSEAESKELSELPTFLFEWPSEAEILERAKPPLVTYWGVPFAMFVVPPLLCFFWYLAWRRLHPSARRRWANRPSHFAAKIIARLRQSEDAATLFVEYLRDHTDFRISTATPADIQQHMRAIGICRDLRRRCVEFITDCDTVVYSPARPANDVLRETAIQLILALEAEPCLRSS